MSNHDLTAEDMFQSLTGFDEIAVLKSFGEDLAALRHRPFMFLRALVFVDLRRGPEAVKDAEARKQALDLTMAELTGWFAEDEPLAEDTDLGKDEPQPSGQPD